MRLEQKDLKRLFSTGEIKRHKKNAMMEKSLQGQCELFLLLKRISYIHLTNFISLKCSHCEQYTSGVIPGNVGVSDLIIFLKNGVTLFIELKSENGIWKEYQKDFMDKMKQLGFEYHLIRSLESFKKVLSPYLLK